MPDAQTFVAELQRKNQGSLDRLAAAFIAGVEKESFEPQDLLRLALKMVIESAEVAALWLVDCEDLAFKVALCEMCGDRARHHRLLTAHLGTLGGDVAYDPREGGYSKLFAFFRGLQSSEERASGLLTLGTFNKARYAAIADRLTARGDAEGMRLFTDVLPADEQRAMDAALEAMGRAAVDEESQARGRRAAFRTMDLLGEAIEPLQLRKVRAKAAR